MPYARNKTSLEAAELVAGADEVGGVFGVETPVEEGVCLGVSISESNSAALVSISSAEPWFLRYTKKPTAAKATTPNPM
jgi:hypothetical protein